MHVRRHIAGLRGGIGKEVVFFEEADDAGLSLRGNRGRRFISVNPGPSEGVGEAVFFRASRFFRRQRGGQFRAGKKNICSHKSTQGQESAREGIEANKRGGMGRERGGGRKIAVRGSGKGGMRKGGP